jgi:multiple sugar transport system ATP-binding protein
VVRDPHAFLFDEPLSNLDAKLRTQMRTEISRLQKQLARTMVYVTHDQVEAMTLGDRIAILRKGALQQVGTARELYEQPVNLFVAGFIGSPSMNFLPATVKPGALGTPFGDVPIDAARIAGRQPDSDVLIAGVRPEQLVDARLLADDARRRTFAFKARVEVIEWLGDEQLLYIPYEPDPRVHEQLVELAHELDAEVPRAQVVANLGVETTIREGEEIELAFDPAQLYVFDPATGARLKQEPVQRAA